MSSLALEVNPEFTIHSNLTVSNIDHFDNFKEDDMFNGYCWYSFLTHTSKLEDLAVAMCFYKDKLHSVRLSLANKDKYGSSWSDWSEAKEKQCASDTASWLHTLGFKPGSYSWGSIWAGYDPKSATGCVVLNCL